MAYFTFQNGRHKSKGNPLQDKTTPQMGIQSIVFNFKI
jgi:hypothetical protein